MSQPCALSMHTVVPSMTVTSVTLFGHENTALKRLLRDTLRVDMRTFHSLCRSIGILVRYVKIYVLYRFPLFIKVFLIEKGEYCVF